MIAQFPRRPDSPFRFPCVCVSLSVCVSIVPQQGEVLITTEFGKMMVEPNEICVIQVRPGLLFFFGQMPAFVSPPRLNWPFIERQRPNFQKKGGLKIQIITPERGQTGRMRGCTRRVTARKKKKRKICSCRSRTFYKKQCMFSVLSSKGCASAWMCLERPEATSWRCTELILNSPIWGR